MVIEPFAAIGDAPSWIHGHGAKLADHGKTIVVSGGELRHGSDRTMAENIDTWSLNVATDAWERVRVLDRSDGRC